MHRGDLDGLLLLDKPSGPTSHDMVALARRLLGMAKVGHTGTLDPLASGLLVLLMGKATRLAPYIPDDPKVYEGCMLLGLSTDSMDTDGTITAEGVYDGGPEKAQGALESLVGEFEQIPPMYSAAKYRGKPLYRYARKGEEVPRKARRVRVYRSEMKEFRELGTRAEMHFFIECSPGTYVRDLAARVGDILGCGGTLSSLRRLMSGPFRVEEAETPQELEERIAAGDVHLQPLELALQGYGRIEVTEAGAQAVRNGSPVGEEILKRIDTGIAEGDVVAVFAGGDLLGMHRVLCTSPLASRALRMM